jgi:hypothetical protein
MTILTTPEQIAEFQLRTLRSALQLEMKGMTRRGRSAYAILKERGYKGTRQAVLDQLNIELNKEKAL